MAQDLFRVGLGIADDNIDYLSGAGAPAGVSGSTLTAPVGSHYTNKTTGEIYVKQANNGAALDWTMLATGGNVAGITTEVDNIEAATGLAANGTFVPFVGTHYMDTATTVVAAEVLLDAQVYTNTGAIASEVSARGLADAALQTEVDAIETGAGLGVDGTYVTPVGSNYLGTATNLKGADSLLDAALNAAVVAQALVDGAQDTTIAGKVSKAGDTMAGNLAFGGLFTATGLTAPVNGSDAATKTYVDNSVSGLSWKAPVTNVGATLPLTAAIGDRFVNTTDGKIYTATALDTWDVGVIAVDGWALMNQFDESGWVFSGTSWVQFSGAGQVVAGVGLAKVGNTIDVNLGAGIAQLPSDEVGIDVLGTGGLFTTVDGTTSSAATGAQLAVLLADASLSTGVGGLQVSAATQTAIANATSGLAAEIVNRTAADGVLQTAINGIIADVDVKSSAAAVTTLAVVDGALVDGVEVAKWIVSVVGTGVNADKKMVAEILATHNGTAAADATIADYTVYAKLKFGSITGLAFDVILSGAGATQAMQLAVSSTMEVNVKAVRTSL